MSPADAATLSTLVAAYDAKDLDRFLACFWESAGVYRQGEDEPLYRGVDELREVYAKAFRDEPQLKVEILERMAAGAFVVDKERVSGQRDGGGVESIVIYQMDDGRIRNLWVAGSTPLTPEDAVATADRGVPPEIVVPGGAPGALHGQIAVVEDDAFIGEAWHAALGGAVTIFPDPYALMGAATASPSILLAFDAVFTDYDFDATPGVTGADVAAWLAARGYKGPVYLCSDARPAAEEAALFRAAVGKEPPSREALHQLLRQGQ